MKVSDPHTGLDLAAFPCELLLILGVHVHFFGFEIHLVRLDFHHSHFYLPQARFGVIR